MYDREKERRHEKMHTVPQTVWLLYVVFNCLFADILRIEDFGEHSFWGWHWMVLCIQAYMGLAWPSPYVCLLPFLWTSVLFSSLQLSVPKPCVPPVLQLCSVLILLTCLFSSSTLLAFPPRWWAEQDAFCALQSPGPGRSSVACSAVLHTSPPSAKWEEQEVTP